MIHVIAVNYFSSAYARELIESLQAQGESDWRLTVVDNSNDEIERRRLEEACSSDVRAVVTSPRDNLGYLGGFNFGLRQLDEFPEWVVMSNMDITFDSGFLAAVGASAGSDVGVIAPRIRNFNGDLNPHLTLRPTAAWARRRIAIFRWLALARMYVFLAAQFKRLLRRTGTMDTSVGSIEIYAPHGSVVVFSREYLEKGGQTVQRPLLFGEEFTIAESCRRLGLRIRYVPEAVAHHVGAVSTGTFRTARMLGIQRESTRHVYRLLCAD